MVTVPPPYSPFGISPANLKYSSGWSSTWTARWFFFGSGGMPLGTAHDTPTPSFSSRRSQCSRLAWCSWTTRRGARASLRSGDRTREPGSGVFLKSLLASYSASFLATRKRLGHGRFLLVNRHRRLPLIDWKLLIPWVPGGQDRTPLRTGRKTGPARPGSPSCSRSGEGRRIGRCARFRSFGFSFVGLVLQLLESHFEADPFGPDLTRPERTRSREAFELRRCVGAALEHLERRPGREGAEAPKLHTVDLVVDVGVRCVPAHVLDHGGPARAKDPVHLGKRAARQREVLERGLADNQVERLALERHVGRVALPELNCHSGATGVFSRDLDERPADVKTCHLKSSWTRHLDRQISRAGRNLEHPGTLRQANGERESLFPVQVELAL